MVVCSVGGSHKSCSGEGNSDESGTSRSGEMDEQQDQEGKEREREECPQKR